MDKFGGGVVGEFLFGNQPKVEFIKHPFVDVGKRNVVCLIFIFEKLLQAGTCELVAK